MSWTFMSISKFYDIWPTLRHVGNMLMTFPTKAAEKCICKNSPVLPSLPSSQQRPRNHCWIAFTMVNQQWLWHNPTSNYLLNHKMDPQETCAQCPHQRSTVCGRKVSLSIKGSKVRPTDDDPKGLSEGMLDERQSWTTHHCWWHWWRH